MKDIESSIESLNRYLTSLEDEWGGDVGFLPPVTQEKIMEVNESISYKLPTIFEWLYTKKSNGIKVDNKAILSVYDSNSKKTFVENIERLNDPNKNLYFKGRQNIFNDYIIVGYIHTKLICISKKYNFPDPLLYICPNPNSSHGVDFYRTDFNLEGIIRKMVDETFIDEIGEELVLK